MKKLLLLVFSISLLTSCAEDDTEETCIEFGDAGIESVTVLPVDTDGSYPIKVDFRVMNGCGNFGSFEESTEGNTTAIKVIAKYEGCICTQDLPLREVTYTFEPTAPGTYTLKFMTADDTFITETIVAE